MSSQKLVYTSAMDHSLMDEVVIYNPFRRGNSWPGLKAKLAHVPGLAERQPKGLRDRSLLLMERRKAQLRKLESASGIEEPIPTALEIATDEAILLKEEAEREERPKAKQTAADCEVLQAAEVNQRATEAINSAVEESSPARKRKKTDIFGILEKKIKVDQEHREEIQRLEVERRAKEEQRQVQMLEEARQERALRKAELEQRKKELEEREKERERLERRDREQHKLMMNIFERLARN